MKNDAIVDKLIVIHGDISNLKDEQGNVIDIKVIVNAAKPTLMGGSGVDGAIHNAVNDCLNATTFKEEIKRELDGGAELDDSRIRCNHGDAVTTSGYGFCDFIIHAVGPKWDGGSKSCIDLLRNTYEKTLEEFFNLGLSTIAIPIISSGSYSFPFELASKVQVATIFNCLIKLKNKNSEVYNKIEKIYLVVFSERDLELYNKIYSAYRKSMVEEKQLLVLKTNESVDAYSKEINYYDYTKRNYFGITKLFRLFLVKSDVIFFISYFLKKIFADKDWHRRRMFIEFEVILKTIFSSILLVIPIDNKNLKIAAIVISIYLLMETITYLSKLVFLSDIQNASANILRSILLLFFNCVEVNLSFAFLYKSFNVLSKVKNNGIEITRTTIDYLHFSCVNSTSIPINTVGKTLVCIQMAVQFYVITIVLAYFIGNFKKIKFNS